MFNNSTTSWIASRREHFPLLWIDSPNSLVFARINTSSTAHTDADFIRAATVAWLSLPCFFFLLLDGYGHINTGPLGETSEMKMRLSRLLLFAPTTIFDGWPLKLHWNSCFARSTWNCQRQALFLSNGPRYLMFWDPSPQKTLNFLAPNPSFFQEEFLVKAVPSIHLRKNPLKHILRQLNQTFSRFFILDKYRKLWSQSRAVPHRPDTPSRT